MYVHKTLFIHTILHWDSTWFTALYFEKFIPLASYNFQVHRRFLTERLTIKKATKRLFIFPLHLTNASAKHKTKNCIYKKNYQPMRSVSIWFKACSQPWTELNCNKLTQLHNTFIDHVRHCVTGCSKTRTAGAESLSSLPLENVFRTGVWFSICVGNKPLQSLEHYVRPWSQTVTITDNETTIKLKLITV